MNYKRLNVENVLRKLGFYFLYIFFYLYSAGPAIGLDNKYVYFMYGYISIGIILIFFNLGKKVEKNKAYVLWTTSLIFYFLLSSFYAINTQNSLLVVQQYILILLKIVTIYSICGNNEGILKLIKYFAYLGALVFITLFFTGKLHETFRLGTELLGNANSFAMIILINLVCAIYHVIYSQKSRLIWVIISSVDLYMILLSGGRKFLLFTLTFMYVLFILESKKKKNIIKATIFVGILLFILYYTIMNVNVLYNAIGIRLIKTESNNGILGVDTQSFLMKAGIEFFKQRPVFGWGGAGYQYLFNINYGMYFYSHSNYIELLTNFGIIGFLIYYLMYFYIISNLVLIKVEERNLKNFFLSFMISLIPFELFAITYNQTIYVPLFLLFACMFITSAKIELKTIDEKMMNLHYEE